MMSLSLALYFSLYIIWFSLIIYRSIFASDVISRILLSILFMLNLNISLEYSIFICLWYYNSLYIHCSYLEFLYIYLVSILSFFSFFSLFNSSRSLWSSWFHLPLDFTINFKNNEFVELRYLKRSKYYMKQER